LGAGRVQMQDFHFVMRVNKASPKLFLACATGDHIDSALLTCRKAGKEQQEYLKVTFSDMMVASYNTNGTGAADVIPMDQISLNFTKVEIEYREQLPSGQLGGTIKAWYNVKTETGG
jgi:type VI secretion system secreted protein Hcp